MNAPQATTGRGLFRWCFEEGARIFLKAYFRTVHRIRITGMERVPEGIDRLIVIANHASYLDGLIVWAFLRLPFRIVVDRQIASISWLRPVFKSNSIVPIDFMNPYALKGVIQMVAGGLPLLIFPEGRRTSTGSLMKVYDGAGLVALKTDASVLPIYLKGTYDTFFAKRHKERRIFAPITMTIGEVRPPLGFDHLPNKKRKEAATRAIYGFFEDLYLEAHKEPSTLGREFVRICKEGRGRNAFADSTGGKASYRKALLGALALGRCFTRLVQGNVAIMLPNLTATAVIFMALEILKASPAFLNYSSGSRGLGLALDLAETGTVITSRQFLERINLSETVFGTRKAIYVEELKDKIVLADRLYALFRYLFPGPLLKMRPGEEKGDAVVLFTSGSEGVPKGVRLSHENVITNVYQGLSRVDVTPDDSFLNVLPMFHSFGLTVGTIIPLFAHARVFFHVNPLHFRIVPELAYDRECTILLATNTFLAGYGRRANPYDFHSVRYAFCGGEPLTDAVFERYARTYGIRVMSGYGATECAPIVSINSALRHEYGTTGAILPGIRYRLAPVEGIDDKGGTVGRLLVYGKNVMKGYLKNDAANRRYLIEDGGWYDTGDIVKITEQGSLIIAGRLKRFAKVSGEMISLSAVEEVLIRELAGRKDLAVIAVADEKRGEILLAVTNHAGIERKQVRDTLKAHGFSELAVPREVRFVKDIPKLGTGKIDYLRLKEMTGLS